MNTEAGTPTRRFPLGKTVLTRGAIAALSLTDVLTALRRHARGDWGEVDDEDQCANDHALEAGFRVLSAYRTPTGTRFWVITEADRSATTVLLPEEY